MQFFDNKIDQPEINLWIEQDNHVRDKSGIYYLQIWFVFRVIPIKYVSLITFNGICFNQRDLYGTSYAIVPPLLRFLTN